MKIIFSLNCIFCFVSISFAQLDITFTGVGSAEGKLVVSIHDSESSFNAKEASAQTTIAANSSELRYKIDDLKPGYYVIRVFHDLNDNDKLDKNFIGIPSEPYGVSNNAKEKFGPPKYKKAKFYYDGTSMSLFIKVDRHTISSK